MANGNVQRKLSLQTSLDIQKEKLKRHMEEYRRQAQNQTEIKSSKNKNTEIGISGGIHQKEQRG